MRNSKVTKEFPKPFQFITCNGHGSILMGFRKKRRDNQLFLGFLRNWRVSKENEVTCDESANRKTAREREGNSKLPSH